MRIATKALITGTLLALSASAVQAVEPKEAIEYRQAVFEVFKWNMGPLGAMAQGKMPFDREKAALYAQQLNRVADMPWQGFVEGSDMGDSEALAEVWTDREGFESKASDFEQAAATLAELVQSEAPEGDIRRQIGAVGQSCKACHDHYRED
ncbi:Cytochrome c556 [Ectothiorhodospira mobilis]|uniref:Cytochrome c556 n=1 Tax=Ectothiorhodospira mobilis TaxID=195064 RepID=A0A1I4PT18_ECTMO|nr:cytochrome c [Ectothiorhodospira mobilis]SFM30640.1 Cytochrome c556 [Ectothiorhodospira mobilis]